MKSFKNQIETNILKSSFGEIFFLDDFINYGSSENVRKVLSRLGKEKNVERLDQSIILSSNKNSFNIA